MGVHDGHRRRLKERAMKDGLDVREEHEVLELLLFFSIPQGDVNVLAHELINRFGSLAGVLEASPQRLMEEPGVGFNTAALLSLMPHFWRQYEISRAKREAVLTSPEAIGRYLLPYFLGEREEAVYVACLDAKRKALDCRLMGRGGLNAATISVRRIAEYALETGASYVILAHNHPSGVALPSKEDEIVTRKLYTALEAFDVTLLDHVVVADGDFVSMAANGFFGRV